MIDRAIIPAAGNGSRLWPLTQDMPKEMLELGSMRMIDYGIEEVVTSGIREMGIIINSHKNGVREYLERRYNRYRLEFFYQPKPLGLGDAIKYAEDWVDDSFAVILPDDIIMGDNPATKELMRVHAKYGTAVIGIAPGNEPERYGVIAGEEVENNIYAVRDLIEKPLRSEAPTNLVIVGRYILTPGIFRSMEGINPRTGEVELTDGLKKLLEKEDVHALVIGGTRFDCGSPNGMEKLEKYMESREEQLWKEY